VRQGQGNLDGGGAGSAKAVDLAACPATLRGASGHSAAASGLEEKQKNDTHAIKHRVRVVIRIEELRYRTEEKLSV